MPTARIFQNSKTSTQSGRANTDTWRLEFEPSEARCPDPLTGWAGSGDTRDQISLTFPTCDAAVGYCERHGWEHVVTPAPQKTLKLQAYADNFK